MSFPVKQRVRFAIAITDASSAFVDPDTLTFLIKNPDGVITTYVFGIDVGIVKDSVGHYHKDMVITDPGNWTFRAEGTGNMDVAKEITELGEPSEFYP